jgi:hypothetical protein
MTQAHSLLCLRQARTSELWRSSRVVRYVGFGWAFWFLRLLAHAHVLGSEPIVVEWDGYRSCPMSMWAELVAVVSDVLTIGVKVLT